MQMCPTVPNVTKFDVFELDTSVIFAHVSQLIGNVSNSVLILYDNLYPSWKYFQPIFAPDKSGKWFEAGRTEKLKDTLSPEWITRIPVDYFENEDSTSKFVVYDFDKNNTDLKKATFLGQYICDFGDIIKGGEKFRQECPMTAQDGESEF